MEVHHHPNVEKKTFKDYFLEFIMIFLAVTLGFIAENIREHFTEQKTARVLAQSFFEDIKKDTASLNESLVFSNKKLDVTDSVLFILHKTRAEWNDTIFYRDAALLFSSFPFTPTDGTFTQMKTSGALRYFQQSLVNLMNAYDVQLKKTKYREDVEDKGIWMLADFGFDKINSEAIVDSRFNHPIQHEMYINLDDKTARNKYINLIVMLKSFLIRSVQEIKVQLKIAGQLLQALNEKYDLT